MSDDKLLDRLMKARLHFARAVVAQHQAGCTDDALSDRVGKCEHAYLDALFTYVMRKTTQGLELLVMPVEGEA